MTCNIFVPLYKKIPFNKNDGNLIPRKRFAEYVHHGNLRVPPNATPKRSKALLRDHEPPSSLTRPY